MRTLSNTAVTGGEANSDEARESGAFLRQGLDIVFCSKSPRWKRPIDFFSSIILILALSPVMMVIGLLVKLTSRGPVLFLQYRAGLGGKPFVLYKFRSMYIDAEARKKELMQFNERNGPVFKMTDDPRVTPLGKWMRKWSLDELPQLFNVLLNDMSLVGPRPMTVEENDACRQWHRKRFDVPPGMTGLWQVLARHMCGFDEQVRIDIEYIGRHSFWLDLKILFMTIPEVISRRGK